MMALALLMKNAQGSLGDEDGQFESTVTIREVWLDWKTKLRKFWEGQSRLQEGKAGKICALFETSGQQGGLADMICTVFWRNWSGAWQPKLCNSWRELAVGSWVTGSRNCVIPKGNWQSAVRSLVAETTQFPRGTGSHLPGAWQQKMRNSWRELLIFSWREKLH